MLVLTRKLGQRIVIGVDTVVIVRSISGNRVRLAIEAPLHTKVLRGELSYWDDPRLPEAVGVSQAGSTK